MEDRDKVSRIAHRARDYKPDAAEREWTAAIRAAMHGAAEAMVRAHYEANAGTWARVTADRTPESEPARRRAHRAHGSACEKEAGALVGFAVREFAKALYSTLAVTSLADFDFPRGLTAGEAVIVESLLQGLH